MPRSLRAVPGQPAHYLGLLVDLLGHEVGMAGAIAHAGPSRQLDDGRHELLASRDIKEPMPLAGDERGLAVLDERHPARVREERALVGGQEVTALAPAEDER